MKERPILFSGPMVRAILEGRKTVTRRVIKPQPYLEMDGEIINQGGPGEIQYGPEWIPVWPHGHRFAGRMLSWAQCPYGLPGDRLWVRETWREAMTEDGHRCCAYRADGSYQCGKRQPPDADRICNWRASIHMPRWASRITLEVVDTRPERLQDITEEDAKREGVVWVEKREPGQDKFEPCARESFEMLWDSINPKHPWASNPWVWRIEFKRVEEADQ